MTSFITDENIHSLVKQYIKDKSMLQPELQNISEWDVSRVTNMKFLFRDCGNFNESLNDWIVDNVTTMKGMFLNCKKFNNPLDKWNVSKVVDMSLMFQKCYKFNKPLNTWILNTTHNEKINLSYMFSECFRFNQPLNEWNVVKVYDMSGMFFKCISFNQPLNDWVVDNVENMQEMFYNCSKFNSPLDEWKVGKVCTMSAMFFKCKNFNQSLNTWEINKKSYDFSLLFYGCESFNQPLDKWKVASVKNMSQMFAGCSKFNQDLNEWNVGYVFTMSSMFYGCKSFNKPLNNWGQNTTDMSGGIWSVSNFQFMFKDCIKFNQSLKAWVIKVESTFGMFSNCPIEENNKPLFVKPKTTTFKQVVDENEVHKTADKINYLTLKTFLLEKLVIKIDENKIIEIITEQDYIKITIGKLLEAYEKSLNNETHLLQSETQKNDKLIEWNMQKIEQMKKNYIMIIDRGLNKNNNKLRTLCMFLVLEYVLLQPEMFRNIYVDSFIFDSANGYEQNTPACEKGIQEQIIFALVPACSSLVQENPEYNYILNVVKFNPQFLIPLEILEWYKMHNHGQFLKEDGTQIPELTEGAPNYLENREDDLFEYLVSKFPPNQEAFIVEQIDLLDFTNESFNYGNHKRSGGKRKQSKHLFRKKNRTQKTYTKKYKKNRRNIKQNILSGHF